MTACGQRYEYDDRTCDRERGHHDQASGWGPDLHRAGEFWWIHHEVPYAEGTEDEGLDIYDEPSNENGDSL